MNWCLAGTEGRPRRTFDFSLFSTVHSARGTTRITPASQPGPAPVQYTSGCRTKSGGFGGWAVDLPLDRRGSPAECGRLKRTSRHYLGDVANLNKQLIAVSSIPNL